MRSLYSYSTIHWTDRREYGSVPYEKEIKPPYKGGIITKIDEYQKILDIILNNEGFHTKR